MPNGNKRNTYGRIERSLLRDPHSLNDAVAKLIGQYRNTFDASMAQGCRVSEKTLSKYASPEHPDRHMPVDVLLALEKEKKSPVVTRFLAAEQGYALVRLPSVNSTIDWHNHHLLVSGEGADVISMLAKALADNRMSRDEATKLLPEVQEAIEAFVGLQSQLIDFVRAKEDRLNLASGDLPTRAE